MRAGENLAAGFVVGIPSARIDGLALLVRPALGFAVDGPVGAVGLGHRDGRHTGGHNLGPDVRLEPVEEVGAKLEALAIPIFGQGAATDPVACLKDDRLQACSTYLACGRTPSEPRTNHDDVVHLRLLRHS